MSTDYSNYRDLEVGTCPECGAPILVRHCESDSYKYGCYECPECSTTNDREDLNNVRKLDFDYIDSIEPSINN